MSERKKPLAMGPNPRYRSPMRYYDLKCAGPNCDRISSRIPAVGIWGRSRAVSRIVANSGGVTRYERARLRSFGAERGCDVRGYFGSVALFLDRFDRY